MSIRSFDMRALTDIELEIWAVQNKQAPACAFAPTNSKEVAFAVKVLTATNTQFAVRGGGHMPIRGANNIDAPGVLLSLTNLRELSLSEDKTVLSICPGHRWMDVYEYLQPHGLVVAGGRVGQVGVPGYLLGGGLSFYSNQHGFGSDTVVKYEVNTSRIMHGGLIDNLSAYWPMEQSSKPQ